MGIIIVQGDRGEDTCQSQTCAVTNNAIHDNVIMYTSWLNYLGSGQGISGTGLLKNGQDPLLAGNSFTGNRYLMPDCGQARWHWVNLEAWTSHSGNFAAFQTQGYEASGSCQNLRRVMLPLLRS